jgi:hypothetical protein
LASIEFLRQEMAMERCHQTSLLWYLQLLPVCIAPIVHNECLLIGAIGAIFENGYNTYAVKVWPLIPAAAERLWSAPQSNYDTDAVHKRLTVFQSYVLSSPTRDCVKFHPAHVYDEIYSYVESLELDKRHATAGGDPMPLPDYDSIRKAAGAKLGARD